ncbi:peptidoglycan-binding protein LysM [Acinetobacter larvae]|uniref:Peptidoglycan-binding protein LysM n=1 Tax=Acinetobacter larvae TaxID=1789224 RepID=A0A1B2LX32_9GAMM|nr:peptidoglycan-binding protein LysM [Acinetobacter larvae]AOA57449.1 peptidoglycan-binding protein LysM [Acinetobacter larvae]
MGRFDFVQGIGKKLSSFKSKKAKAARKLAESEVSMMLQELIREQRFNIANLVVDYNSINDVATIHGQVSKQAEREKIILLVGNIDHVVQVNDQMKVLYPEPESSFYTVQSGDTLRKIAHYFYGDTQYFTKLFEANRPMLNHVDDIFIGQVLRVPQ